MGGILHRVVIGRTREVRGPDALERFAAGVTVAVVVAIAAGYGARSMLMAQTLDALSMARFQQINAVVYRAEHGRWPPPASPTEVGHSRVTHVVQGGGGVITAELALGSTAGAPGSVHGFLSFRPELLGSKEAPAISFLCGYAKPVAGAVEGGAADRTSIPRKYLPPFCR